MIDKVYAVLDVKMNLFLPPFTSRNTGTAIRAFGDMYNNPASPFGKHPEDYVLYEIGSMDCEKGTLTGSNPHVIAKALDFVKVSSGETLLKEALTDA